jgi:tRNA threonylcarbamoyladenosine biosynthesis protein TsaB
MNAILLIETSTRVCSVGVSVNGTLAALREEHSQNYSHSSVLTTFIQDALEDAGLKMQHLAAVAVSMGPGSYTGLRIGVSAAKGICYGLEIPLIAVDTLQALAWHARQEVEGGKETDVPSGPGMVFCPMIDARRMEVYYNLFDHEISPLGETRAQVIETGTFDSIPPEKTLLVVGDGAEKCRQVIRRQQIRFMPQVLPSVKGMLALAQQKWEQKAFEDVAYFEPFYLKDFIAGPSRVKGLKD